MTDDPINHPSHYTTHPSGVECIQITEHMVFNLGNAIKYIWRADLKGDALEDLRKAAWYVQREIDRRSRTAPQPDPTMTDELQEFVDRITGPAQRARVALYHPKVRPGVPPRPEPGA